MGKIEQIKNIISVFLNISEDNIINDTVIDRSVIQGSIKIHRMYSAIAKLGYLIELEDYIRIKTFGELLYKLGLISQEERQQKQISEIKEKIPALEAFGISNMACNNDFALGIDMERVDSMPKADDFREDAFYKQNFSESEISYCLLRPNQLQSFAGKFAAKEAIVKADGSFKNVAFNQIEINNDREGRPYFNNFLLSISHTDDLAVAIAVKSIAQRSSDFSEGGQSDSLKTQRHKINLSSKLSVAAIIIALLALISVFIKFFSF